MKPFLPAAMLAAAFACTLPVHAAQFTITPVRIFMTPKDRAVAVTVTNESDEEVVMQADLYSWKQTADGSDDLVLTEDLILTPPILKLPPKGRQVVRLARLTPPPAGVQQTYRLIVRDLQLDLRAAPDQVRALCSNTGTAYTQIRALEVFDDKGARLAARDSGGYLLPTVKRSFEIKRADGKIPAGKVKLQVALDDGTLQSFDGNLPE